MRPDDVMLTVADYAIDKVTRVELRILQRFFLKEFCGWLPMRAIAEMTGGKSHNYVSHAVKVVNRNHRLFTIGEALRFILKAKQNNQYVNLNAVRFVFDRKINRAA